MNTLFAKLSIRTLLYLSVTIPLLGVVLVSGHQVWASYQLYVKLDRALLVQRLAMAGGDLALAQPTEYFSPPDKRMAARKHTDEAFETLFAVYGEAAKKNIEDQSISQYISTITAGREKLIEFRSRVDAAGGVMTPELRADGVKLQPLSAAGIGLTRRAGAVIDDLELSRLIQGFYALMEVNDAGLIEMSIADDFFRKGTLNPVQQGFIIHSRSLFSSFTDPMFEFLPTEFTKRYADFLKGDENIFMQSVREKLYSLVPQDTPDTRQATRWASATADRLVILGGALEGSAKLLNRKGTEKLQQARDNMLFYGSLTLGIVLISVALSLLCIAGISNPLRQIVYRMKALAEGDTESDVPYETRNDEIGEISHAVSYFRNAEVEKNKLQQEAEGVRRNFEAQRIEAQERAEEEANQRLNQTTYSLATGLQRLASGDMKCEIDEQFAPQFEALRENFNASVTQLREALSTVGELASEVDSDSAEISSASANLARRTEQQAASLEETAAALEEITVNVVSTTKRTGEARNIVQQARARAEKSTEVVSNAVAAMKKIEDSSRKINQIIGVIDEIAFQTNLLALNAGVEAARAGDAGKGFAVVAQEVRELAQRSANAAKEIKQLISNSAIVVNEGVKLVNDTGEGLTEIDQLVRMMNEQMDAIAIAAQEQSAGLAEVNGAVNHMDQATQQNAAMVEEMSAAGDGLAKQSAELKSLLSRFHIGAPSEALRHMASIMRKATPDGSVIPSEPRRLATAAAGVRSASAGNWEEF